YTTDTENFTAGTLFQKLVKPQILDILVSLIELGITAKQIGEGTEELRQQTELIGAEVVHLQELQDRIAADDYQTAYQLSQSFEFNRWKAVKKSADDSIKEAGAEMKTIRDQIKKRYSEMQGSYFNTSLENQVEIMGKAAPLVEEMARVTALFTQAY